LKLSDELPDTFYTCTTKAENFDFESFFKSTGNKIHPKFYDFLNRFNKHKYLYSYKEDASITYALNRTFSRVRQENIPQEMEKEFYEVIHFTEEEINLNFDLLLGSI